MKAIIAGGGIGGLTAALCLQKAGLDVHVIERSDNLGEVGAGIQISPNGMKVFAALGMEDRIAAQAFRPQMLEMRLGRSGRRVFSIPVADQAVRRWGAPYRHIHRADLLDVLASSLEARAPGSIVLNAKMDAYRQTPEHVTADLADGTSLEADVLIGADGIHSAIRTQMSGPDAPVFTGCVAWRAVVPVAELGDCAPPPTACVWVGPGRHAVTYRLRGGDLANFVGVVERDDWTAESWTQRGSRDEALADFAGWHPIVTRLIDRADAHFRWALFDRPPLTGWTDGRVALLGDACHPMLPFMAQGAVMAIEDAWRLAAEIKTAAPNGIESALSRYACGRMARTARVQKAARANARTFHRRTFAGQIATYGPMWMAGKLLPGVVRGRQDWLYGFDPTAA